MRHLFFLLMAALTGCAANGYREFYKSHVDVTSIPHVRLLNKGEKPTVYSSSNLERDIKIIMSKGFIPIGESSFNGALQSEDQVVSQAREVGALVVLVNATYTDTQINTVPIFLPNSSTTYGSGTVYGSGGFASYSGSSTTRGSTLVPVTTQQRRFDQRAVYFVGKTTKPRFGVFLVDLPPELRVQLQRNTGAVVDVVVEDSPAFYANLLPGDVLIQLDGVSVRNPGHALALMNAAPPHGESEFKIIRDSTEKIIKIPLN